MKMIRLMVVLVMVFSLMTGCRTDGDSENNGTTSTTGNSSTTGTGAKGRSSDMNFGFDMER